MLGNGYSGVWSWFLGFYDKGAVNAQSNAQLMPSVTDPLNKMIYEVHQYFGTSYDIHTNMYPGIFLLI